MALITDLVQTKKNNKQMYEVYIDGENVGLYHLEIVVKHGLQVGKKIEREDLEKALIESSTILAMEKSLNYLSKAMKSKKEMIKYLYDKGYKKVVVDAVISKLEEYNYINDLTYAKYFLSTRESRQGNKKTKYELKTKGISDEIINELMEDREESADAIKTLADKFINKKAKTIENKNKLIRHLLSKGFEYASILNVIKEYNFVGNDNEDWL